MASKQFSDYHYPSGWSDSGAPLRLDSEAAGYIPAFLDKAPDSSKEADLAEAHRLAAKHGFKIQKE